MTKHAWAKLVLPFIILGIGGFISLTYRDNPNSGEYACTEEALQCPDGSYVGRTGPVCAFAPCPSMPSVTGILRQNSNGFQLITGAPEGGHEVSYVLPITVNVTNALGQLVGKKVRAYGTFSEGNTLSVERLEELPGESGEAELGEIGVGKSIFINGVKIILNEVVSDSRCPADAVCVWVGAVTANVTLQSDTDKTTLQITSGADPIPFDSFQVSIAGAEPSPLVGKKISQKDYLITFRVAANKPR
jgi:hypothetical protein